MIFQYFELLQKNCIRFAFGVYFALGPGNEAHSEARVFEQIYPRESGESNEPGQCFNDGSESGQDENYVQSATLPKGDEVCAMLRG